ncbi:MAG: hypothetical protein A2481_02925 [Candidatus Yonathbacteria bacterium RIFOXYC2_FULL_47_9]|nr:MAG: hypothetical protein A2481_02925 [Candidatus Yonathbacteria bacterium RIFOXYC2_FULL_47_9]HAT68104.1 hypothetical protein [Candidatus Yonathbacteria bacterium]
MFFDLDKNIERLKSEKYDGQECAEFFADVERLKAGEPYAYILGWIDFLGVHIDLSGKPIIPRPETAHWAKRAIEELKVKGTPVRTFDAYAGSGNVGLAVAKYMPNALVEISELDASLSEGIILSARASGIPDEQIRVLPGDSLETATGLYDAIFANPPYIPPSDLENLDPDMVAYEPHLAFFADEGGNQFHKVLIDQAWDYLKPGGAVYIEADEYQRPAIEAILKDTPWTYEFWEDQYGQVRFPVLRKIV